VISTRDGLRVKEQCVHGMRSSNNGAAIGDAETLRQQSSKGSAGGDPDIDGGPTELLLNSPFQGEDIQCSESSAGPTAAVVLSFVSLNDKTAANIDFAQNSLPSHASDGISFGRGPTNTVVLQDPRVSLRHFTIRLFKTNLRTQGAPPEEGIVEAPMSSGTSEVASNAGNARERMASVTGGRVHPLGYALQLVDESTNGTWVNNQQIAKDSPVSLASGDRIFLLPAARVGQTEIVGFVVVIATAPPAFTPEQNLGHQLVLDVRCRLCKEKPIHRCVTTVPCGHIFDLGCLVAWRNRSSRCPECGSRIMQIVRNRSVDSITETFLRSHPEAARARSTLSLLDLAECSPTSQTLLTALLAGVPTPARAPFGKSTAVSETEAQTAIVLPSPAELPRHLQHLSDFLMEPTVVHGALESTPANRSSSCEIS